MNSQLKIIMDDNTFNFMSYMKYYRPLAHDNLIAMAFMGINQANDTLDEIFKSYAKPCKFPWKRGDINVFQIRMSLLQGHWNSAVWDRLVDSAFIPAKNKYPDRKLTKSPHLTGGPKGSVSQ